MRSLRVPVLLTCLMALLAACNGSEPRAASTPTPTTSSPTPSPPPGIIPNGTYKARLPVTRDEAAAVGLEGDNITENVGLFTVEFAGEEWKWSQETQETVENPFILGTYIGDSKKVSFKTTYPAGLKKILFSLNWKITGDKLSFTLADVSAELYRPGILADFTIHPFYRVA